MHRHRQPLPAHQSAGRRASASTARGFTLVELLIVVMLLIGLSAVLAPMLVPSPARLLQATAGEIATTLRETRRQARADGARRRFVVDMQAGEFGVEGATGRRRVPEDMAIELTTGRLLLTGDARGGIDFFPDGSSTGGRVALSLADRTLRVDVEWLTGHVRLSGDAP